MRKLTISRLVGRSNSHLWSAVIHALRPWARAGKRSVRTGCQIDMRLSWFRLVVAAAALAGCASVTTQVTVFDPAYRYAPTQNVVVLLDYPARPHIKIALIEAQGTAGGSESELLEDARKKAQALGADAIVRLEVVSVYQPPVRVYDPWYGDPFYWRYGYPYLPFYAYPSPYGPFPFYGDYRSVGGGNVQTLKAVAIKYTVAGDGGGKSTQ